MSRAAWLRVREMVLKEMRQLIRDPRTRLMMFVAPVIQLVMFGYAVNTDIKNTATYVLDHDGTAASRELIDAFRATGYFAVERWAAHPAELRRALEKGDALVAIEIPRGFQRSLARRSPARVQVLVDGSESNTATVAQAYAQRIVQRYGLAHAQASGTLPRGGIDLESRAWYNPNLESRTYNVPAVVGVLVLLMSLLLTALSVVRERELGTLDQLMVSPLRPGEFIAGKTLPVVLVGVIDLVLISLLAVYWFGIPIRGSRPALLAAALLYILAGISVGLLISSISKTQQEAFMTMFLFVLPAVILSGFFYPISSMPVGFQWLTLLNPVRHFLEIIRAIFLKGQGVAGLWPQYAALTIIASLAFWAAVRRLPQTVRS